MVEILLERMEVNVLAEPRTKLSEIMAVFVVFNTLENHQAWDAQEDLSLAALDLLLKFWVLGSKCLHMLTEGNYLFPIGGVNQMVFARCPRTLVELNKFCQLSIVLKLWVYRIKILRILV